MKKSFIFSLLSGLFLLTFLIVPTNISAQQTDREKGLELYKKGDYQKAVQFLEQAIRQKAFEKDGDTWNFLGLSYLGQNDLKAGRKAFEKAVKYVPNSSGFHSNLAYAYLLENKINKSQSEVEKAISLDTENATAYYIRGSANIQENKAERAVDDAKRATAIDPKFTAAYVLYADGLLSIFGKRWSESSGPQDHLGLLETAKNFLEQCLEKCPQDKSINTITEKIEAVDAFSDYYERTKDTENQPDDAKSDRTSLKVLSKPKADYTSEAREKGEEGEVELAVLFGSDAKIKHIIVLRGLNYGLTKQALKAAVQITFEPETEKGKSVSIVKRVIYNFSIY